MNQSKRQKNRWNENIVIELDANAKQDLPLSFSVPTFLNGMVCASIFQQTTGRSANKFNMKNLND